ncbi:MULTISPECIES: hypothetical protein [Streptomyces]|uniref:hypothetical protein n=1 Tax=Streptomyces TaxID=1883 RepID=UPI0004AA01D9|nr:MULTISPECIES: hypothetical protein [Streptomyces]
MTSEPDQDRGPTLGEVLGSFRPAGPPGAEVRHRRRQLADFVRAAEPRVHRAPAADRERMRRLLGWDDESLHRFVSSPMVVHTSTHASLNAYAPMLTFPWYALRLISQATGSADGGTHLRTLLTHNNVTDHRWKPNSWWRCDRHGRLVRTQVLSQRPRFRHQILLTQPVPEITADDLAPTDTEALELARHATNFAYFAMIYRISLERQLGLHVPGGTVEVPIDMMNTFSLTTGDYDGWVDTLYTGGYGLRGIGADNKLQDLPRESAAALAPPEALDLRSTLICPNYMNLGHSYRMSVSATIGADRMTAYEAEMGEVLSRFFRTLGEEFDRPQFLGVSRTEIDQLAPLPDQLVADLADLGGQPSFPLYAATYGERLVPALDAALERPVGTVATISARGAAARALA